ncbi:MAG TPA: hypothetical protein VKA46_22365 [Gemmataceae bacterium]|nr:hypothetical protein [Gemmataceae bacterium]
MKRQVITAVTILAAFLFLVLAQQPSPAQRKPSSPEWEFKAVSFDTGENEGTNKLNVLTAEGWQYVGPLANGLVAFRRPAAERAVRGTSRTPPRESPEKGAGDGEAPPRPAAKLPKGAITLDLPDEPVRFHYVNQDGEGLVEVATKSLKLRLPRVFVRDGDNVLCFEATKDHWLSTMVPNGQSGWYFNDLTVGGGAHVVPGSRDGGFGLIRPGDVVVTSPRFKIEISSPK